MRLLIFAISIFTSSLVLAQGQPYPPQGPPPNYPPQQPGTNYPQPNYPPQQQPYPQQQRRPMAYPGYQRSPYDSNRGFMAGIGLGFSSFGFDCDACQDNRRGGVGIDFQLGWFLNPRMALMYDANFWGRTDSEEYSYYERSRIAGIQSLALQFWVMPQLWIKGGIGIATDQTTTTVNGFREQQDINNGAGFTFGAGFEVVQMGNFAFDISGRFNAMTLDTDVPVSENNVFEEQGAKASTVSILFGARWK